MSEEKKITTNKKGKALSVDPFSLYVSCTHAEQEKTECNQHRKTHEKSHVAVVAYQGL